jgi:D-alanyl-D-alanine carboxypeptidase
MKTFSHLKSTIHALALLLFLAGCSDSDDPEPIVEPDPIVDPESRADIYQPLLDEMVNDKVPGVILLVETPEEKFLSSAGFANQESQTLMQPYHQMPTGSSGKPMTALLATMLHHEGILNLDNTLDFWLEEALVSQIENGTQITLRQLLSHTSGVYDYLDETALDYFEAVLDDPETLKTDEFALQFALNQPAYFLPGQGFQYSNTGYLLAGLILDQVLGQHHSTEFRNRILMPLALTDTYYAGLEKERGDIISGYYEDEDFDWIDTKFFQQNIGVADAPVVSTVENLALFLKSFVTDDTFTSQTIKDTLFSDENLIAIGEDVEYGMGIFVEKEIAGNNTMYHHGGLEPGYSVHNIYIKEIDLSVTAFVNCGSELCEEAIDTLVQTVLNSEL